MRISSLFSYTWQLEGLLSIFTHFMFTKLPRCSKSIISLIYIYIYILFTDSQLLFMSAWSQSCLITLLYTTTTPKNFCYHPLTTKYNLKFRSKGRILNSKLNSNSTAMISSAYQKPTLIQQFYKEIKVFT